MSHYVNIAWGFIFWPCLFVRGSGWLFAFLFLPLKNQSIENKKAMCRMSASHKKHDGKNYRRVGVGEVNKRQRECRFFLRHGWVLFAVGRVGLWVLFQRMEQFKLLG